MAANNYVNYTGTPLPYTNTYTQTPMQSYQQAPQYQAPAVTPQQTNGSLLAVIITEDQDVDYYPVQAGTTVMLINFNSKKFYLKSRGNNGVPSPVRVFPFKEETPVYQNQNGGVSRDEFNALSSKLDRLLKELGGTGNEQQ